MVGAVAMGLAGKAKLVAVGLSGLSNDVTFSSVSVISSLSVNSRQQILRLLFPKPYNSTIF